ncbi:MAG: NAD(+) synthase [Treponema sp.]|nr:NAD(+) synthase [Spirochaetia bacterium]MDD7460743.1 NAD(+) synthase [Spirochaetales bacterium]MDY5810645.1 NAD(+) synthase [Treponema sp.]
MNYGYFRAACVSPSLTVADPLANEKSIIESVKKAQAANVCLLVFPELSITAYTCQDLFQQKSLETQAVESLKNIALKTKTTSLLFAVGLPLSFEGNRYNCAAFVQHGKVLAIIPKTFIPNYGEFYESRWFASWNKTTTQITLGKGFEDIPFGTDIIIEDKNDANIKIACEICEDLWVPLAPSARHALKGATIIANLSAGNEVAQKADYRRTLVSAHSAKITGAYIYANAGHDESTTDMVFSGHNLICLNGSIKAESTLFEDTGKLLIADLDLEKIMQDRLKSTTFTQGAYFVSGDYKIIYTEFKDNKLGPKSKEPLYDFIDPHPFVPSDEAKRRERCLAVIEMQSEGLAKRLRHINAKSAVIGLSGGLDSTLALLVTARAFDKCDLDRKNIYAITMPAFGTTDRTYKNACLLAEKTGATLKEIDIKKSVTQHYQDIGHDINVHDITYENGQARGRTYILMDYANKTGGIVIGTGDLSELALGWCTYNGDHMSMYGVNSSIPKTLVRYLVSWFADDVMERGNGELSKVLIDILNTPVSPELLPPENGTISQKTEELVGPYELHDFFLYYVLRFGYSPKKIFYLACTALEGKKAEGTKLIYTKAIILKWLKSFYRRFFTQQFKRSCMPDGAKVGTVNLSPRGDWRMPSDASFALWQKECDALC